MTESTLVYLLVSAALGLGRTPLQLDRPESQPSDIPPLPTGSGHGQIAEWLARTALQLAKELLAAQASQPPNPAK
jgi:hypothetical protein